MNFSAVFIATLISSILSIIVSSIVFFKDRSKTTGANLILTVTTFIGIILSRSDNNSEELAAGIQTAVQTIVFNQDPEEEDLSQAPPAPCSKIEIKEELKDFLRHLRANGYSKGNIRFHHTNSGFEHIILPPGTKPTDTPIALRNVGYSFDFPDWFLAPWWSTTMQAVEKSRRIYDMAKKCENCSEDMITPEETVDSPSSSSYIPLVRRVMTEEERLAWEQLCREKPADAPTIGPIMKDIFLQHSTVEVNKGIFYLQEVRTFFLKIIMMIAYLGECTWGKQRYSTATLLKSMSAATDGNNLVNDATDVYKLINGEETARTTFLNQISSFTTRLSFYLEKPNFEYSKRPRTRTECSVLLIEFQEFYNNLSQANKTECYSVHGLYVALNQKYTLIMSTEIQNMSRQEPFVVMFRGEGGIGKTQYVKHLMRQTALSMGLSPAESIIEISSEDKYWPPLSNQELALFDEAGSKRDYREDLLFNNLKSICSPAFFNGAAADIAHKTNPVTFKVIFATTNTSFDEMASRVANISDAATWQAMCRRMITIDCTRNTTFSKISLDNPLPSQFDNVHFKHLTMCMYKYKNGRLTTDRNITHAELADLILTRETRMSNEFAALMMANQSVPENSKNHFSTVIHGRMGQGKTFLVSEIKHTLGNALHMPVVFFSDWKSLQLHRSKQREIVIIDDLVRYTITSEQEDILMDFFNHRLTNNSVIIYTTNISPQLASLNFRCGISMNNTYPFKNEGLIRRIGYQGYFDGSLLPVANLELYVNNYIPYQVQRNRALQYLDPIVTGTINNRIKFWLFTLLHCYLTYIPVVSFYILFRWHLSNIYTPLNSVDVPKLIYDKYVAYLGMRKQIRVEYRDTLDLTGNFTMALYANLSRNLFKGNTNDMIQRTFITHAAFLQCDKDWKVFIHETAATAVQKNLERFYLRTARFDEETVISIIKRYVDLFVELGLVPRFSAVIDDVGIFLYEDGVLYITRYGRMNALPVGIYNHNGRVIISVDDKDICVRQFLTSPTSVYEGNDFTYAQSLALKEFVQSPRFLANQQVAALRTEMAKDHLKALFKNQALAFKDKFVQFASTFHGKIVIVLISVYVIFKIGTALYSFIKSSSSSLTQKRTSKKGSPKKRNYETDDDKQMNDTTDSESDEEVVETQKKTSKKGSPKRRSYDTDDDKPTKPVKNTKQVRRAVKEDVMRLIDMNDFDSHKPLIEHAYKACRKNLCQVYTSYTEDKEVLEKEPTGTACYGLFVKDNLLVTVGHVREVNAKALYAGADEFPGKFYKMHLVRGYQKRDLSVWYINNPISRKDLTKFFFNRPHITEDDVLNSCLQRFAPGKIEEFHVGVFSYFKGPDMFDQELMDWGSSEYATSDIKLTDAGDCGLPYYCMEKYPGYINHIFGIHCRGNLPQGETFGIMSMIFKEDIELWTKDLHAIKQIKVPCDFCTRSEISIEYDTFSPKCEDHQNVWHSEHISTIQTAIEEITIHQKSYPGFVGTILKHSGVLKGTVDHSHTQFLPAITSDIGDICNWKEFDIKSLGTKFDECEEEGRISIFEVKYSLLPQVLKRYKEANGDFRLKINVYHHPKTSSNFARVQILMLANNTKRSQKQMNIAAFPSYYGAPVHVPEDVQLILDGAKRNIERGKQEDIPFKSVPNNQTVKVIGSFMTTKSHMPAQKYVLSPFSQAIKDIIPIEKAPTVFDPKLIPEQAKEAMVLNNYGEPCQLATQAINWAHPIYGNKMQLRAISEEFKSKILRYYSNLTLLDDQEVINGMEKKKKFSECVLGMELDSAIGFTLKELFYVTKKSDVITCDENGKYSWLKNPAADYLKEMYEQAKEIQDRGDKYISVFTEMLKMEKLKLSKRYVGRTFVAQDILGVLMERRALGTFAARAMGADPNCGVGTDPAKDFNKIFNHLNRHPNLWAGDYKKFDRSIPAAVFYELRDLLAECNPQIANQIKSTFNVLTERIQVTGKTLAEVLGGMPSGCFNTATLNSLVNDYILFACYMTLCGESGTTVSYSHYEKNVARFYYGDDVILSVSNEMKQIFNRSNVSRCMKTLFGMTLDSSDKDGKDNAFDTFINASWISRYFRQLGRYPLTCGALKKISIGANFHYVTSNSLEHLGNLMERAQYEAAFWEKEYYDTIQEAIRRCLDINPRLGKFVDLKSLSLLRESIFHTNRAATFVGKLADRIKETDPPSYAKAIKSVAKVSSWADEVDEELPFVAMPVRTTPLDFNNKTFFRKYYFPKLYYREVIKSLYRVTKDKPDFSKPKNISENQQAKMPKSYVAIVNELFQKGEIPKPEYVCYEMEPGKTLAWGCALTIDPYIYYGQGNSKAESREEAAYHFLCETARLFPLKESSKFTASVKEMNMTPSNKIPSAPMTATDVSVVTDSGLYTNTAAPSPAKILNETAIAIDNPCGSGAPFSKHTAVYNIYQRWSEKNTVINPTLASGTEILRLSLDPADLPTKIKEYVMFHEAIIPSIEIVIAIAGAAGTIGWIQTAWVADASPDVKYSLDDLQQISSETSNMNGTQIIKIVLNDIRRTGLYRKTVGDPEPYPGIIMMVDHAVTNVQRNDAVNYPVRVQVRLTPNCVLMKPFATPSAPVLADFDLGSYFYQSPLDLIVLGSSVTSVPSNTTLANPSSQFTVGDFVPSYANANILVHLHDDTVLCYSKDPTPTAEFINGVNTLVNINDGSNPGNYLPPIKVLYAFGNINAEEAKFRVVDENDYEPPLGSHYQISQKVIINGHTYNFNDLYSQDSGCWIVGTLDYTLSPPTGPRNYPAMIVNNRPLPFDPAVNNAPFNTSISNIVAVMYQDINHNNEVVGNNTTCYVLKQAFKGEAINITTDATSVKTYVCTGNTMPATNLDVGLKLVSFSRPGTSTTQNQDIPIAPITMPILPNAFSALDKILSANGISKIAADLEVDGTILGQIGYSDQTIVVRTDSFFKLKAGISNEIMLRNMRKIDDFKGLQTFNMNGYANWSTSRSAFRTRRSLASKFYRSEKQAAIAGGAMTGLGNGISSWANQIFQQQAQERYFKQQSSMQESNNIALQKRQQQAFENNLTLLGYNSASTQHGIFRDNNSVPRMGAQIGPVPEHTDNMARFNQQNFPPLGDSFVRGSEPATQFNTGVVPPSHSTLNPEAPEFTPKSNSGNSATPAVSNEMISPDAVSLTPQPKIQKAEVVQNNSIPQTSSVVPVANVTNAKNNN